MQTKLLIPRVLTTLATVGLMVVIARADTVTNNWIHGGSDYKWSTPANWDGGALTGEDFIVFTNIAVEGVIGDGGTPDNIVDTDQTIQGFYALHTNTPTGQGHTTLINPGVSLVITGSVQPVFWVGAGTVIDWGKDAVNDTTIYGNGSLSIVNPDGDFIVRQTSATAGAHRATLDMSGLETFSAQVNRVSIGDTTGTGKNARPAATVMLAKTNFIACFRGTSAQDLIVGQGQAQAGNGTLYLGQTNAIFSDAGLTVGRQKCTAWLGFNTNIVMDNPVALFRNNAGTGRQNVWAIGDHSTGGTTTGNRGTVDFTYGTVDAMVDTMYVGRGQTDVGAAGRGTLYFSSGIIDVNTLNVGYQRADGSPGQGWVYVDGEAQLVVNGDLLLGYTVGSTAPSTGQLNIGQTVPGGSVWIKGNVVEGGGTDDYIYLTGGSLKTSGNVGQDGNPLQNMALANGSVTFDLGTAANPTAPLWYVVNFQPAGTVTNNIEGTGLTLGQFPLIKYTFGTIFGDGFSALQLGSMPAHLSGFLSNNTGNFTVDLVITNDSSPKWNGNVAGGDWDIDSTYNWVTVTGGLPTSYHETEVPGDKVIFDDTATGTTTVNLTTTLSPMAVTVDNSSKDYTFTGSGHLSGPTGLNKSGSRTLTISNTGSSDFTGPVLINGGKLMLAGSADRLPTNAAVALADVAGASLDLNGQDQALGSLSGGGYGGGNVTLGAGTLTIQAGGGAYSGAISGSGSLVKSGSGTQYLNSASAYEGGTLVSGGTLAVANQTGSATGPGSITVETNGTFQIGDGAADGSVAVSTITNNGIVAVNRSDDLTWGKYLTGSGGFAKYNDNKVTMSAANDYSGPTYIYGGILHVTDVASLGTTGTVYVFNGATAALELPGSIDLSKPMSISQKPASADLAPGIVNLAGVNTLAGPINGAGGGTYWTFQVDAGTLAVTGPFTAAAGSGQAVIRITGNGDCDWQGDIITPPDYAGTTWLNMSGAGTWTLSGNVTMNGKAVVKSGMLMVNGNLLGSTNITVEIGTLGGTGLIEGPVYVSDTLSPGTSIGTLTISNLLVFNPTGVAVMEVSHSAYDQVAGLSSVTFAGTLRVVVSGSLQGGEAFKLFDAVSYDGDFASYDLPALSSPLSWDTSTVATDGTLRVAGSFAPQVSSVGMTSGGNFQISGTGPGDWTYVILATTNVAELLSNWVPVATNVFTGGVFSWTDPDTGTYSRRFYQIVTQSP